MGTLVIAELLVVLAMIFIGARVGGIGLGIYGMIGVFVLVFGFGLKPGSAPIDVMMIIVAVITAAAALQASGGLEYLVGIAAKFLRKHPEQITYFGPLTCWLFCVVAGTAHTSYSLLPIISEIAQANKIRPERPMSLSVIAASLGITGSRVGKKLEDDPEYKRRVAEGIINPEEDKHNLEIAEEQPNPHAKYSVWAFFAGVILVVIFGFFPKLRPEGVTMSQTIEMVMMSIAAVILLVGKAKASDAVNGNIFKAGVNAVVAIFGIAWMGSTFYLGNQEYLNNALSGMISTAPFLFTVALFIMSIMLFSQAATVTTLYPVGVALGINPMFLVAMFPACNGYFFLPNYPTEVAAIDFDRTGTTRVGKYVINHSFQLPGFVTTIVSIGVAALIVQFL